MNGIRVNGLTGRLWMCKRKDGHALGLIVMTSMLDGLVEQLYLFRNSVETVSMTETDAKIMCRVDGTVHDIECEICGTRRTWYEGKGALKRAVASYLAE